MPLVLPSADLTLAPTVGPLVRSVSPESGGGSLRRALNEIAGRGFAAVQLDATLAGIRPRDLSRTGRKDLGALLMRSGLRLAGLDLFIPRQEFTDPARLDRAMAAALGAIELAADLGRVPLSLALPVRDLAADARATLVEAADGRSIRLAVHAEDQLEDLTQWLASADHAVLGAGLDPAALLSRQIVPDKVVHHLAPHLTVARLCDCSADGLRCPVGKGELPLLNYRIALQLAQNRAGPVVLDLRGLETPLPAAITALRAW